MMLSIELPNHLSHRFWLEYCDMNFGSSGHKGFRSYIQSNISEAVVEGTIQEGFILKFDNEEDLVAFKLRWP